MDDSLKLLIDYISIFVLFFGMMLIIYIPQIFEYLRMKMASKIKSQCDQLEVLSKENAYLLLLTSMRNNDKELYEKVLIYMREYKFLD